MSEFISVVLFMASIAIYSVKAGRNIFWFTTILIILGLFIILNATLFASNYFTGEGITDAVIYTMTNSMTGAGISKYVLPAIGLMLALFLIFCLLSWILRRKKQEQHRWRYSLLAVLLALGSINTTPAFQQVSALIAAQIRQGNSDFDSYYKVPKKLIATPELNVVYIYGESLERTYFNNQTFPGLTPELGRLKDQSIDFSHTEQLPGTDYTIAGMVASQCGIPLFAPFDGNASSALSTFYPQNVCLGDILKASGYQNVFIQGADLRFSGKDLFLKSHGFDQMYGAQELKESVADPAYRNAWGFYDDTVMDEVFKKYSELSAAGKPFALFALTVDTHHPDGFISRSCQRKSYSYAGKPNQSFSAVACSQEHVARLITRIMATPGFKNTVIVVTSDHLAMNNTAHSYLIKQPRNDLFFILRGDKPQHSVPAMPRSTLDNGATLLDILGGDNFIGLGRSSLSSESLSAQFPNLKDKVNEWKHDIIQLWNFPKSISDYRIDKATNSLSFSGSRFKLPVLLRVSPGKVEPLLEGEYIEPLRYQLAKFQPEQKFVWLDRCYKMARLWDPALALSTDLCVANGQLGAQPQLLQVPTDVYQGKIRFDSPTLSDSQYQQNVRQLRTEDNDIRYHADRFLFAVPGAPDNVRHYEGLSYPELWGRWSDASLTPQVKIEYVNPLPASFDLTITARAFGSNVHWPIPVRVGDQQQLLMLNKENTTITLHFTNRSGSKTLIIAPQNAELTTEDNIADLAPRRLGIGMVEMKITPTPPG